MAILCMWRIFVAWTVLTNYSLLRARAVILEKLFYEIRAEILYILYSEVVYQLYIENNRPHWRQTGDINVLVQYFRYLLLGTARSCESCVYHELGYAMFHSVFVKLNETVYFAVATENSVYLPFWQFLNIIELF